MDFDGSPSADGPSPKGAPEAAGGLRSIGAKLRETVEGWAVPRSRGSLHPPQGDNGAEMSAFAGNVLACLAPKEPRSASPQDFRGVFRERAGHHPGRAAPRVRRDVAGQGLRDQGKDAGGQGYGPRDPATGRDRRERQCPDRAARRCPRGSAQIGETDRARCAKTLVGQSLTEEIARSRSPAGGSSRRQRKRSASYAGDMPFDLRQGGEIPAIVGSSGSAHPVMPEQLFEPADAGADRCRGRRTSPRPAGSDRPGRSPGCGAADQPQRTGSAAGCSTDSPETMAPTGSPWPPSGAEAMVHARRGGPRRTRWLSADRSAVSATRP